MICIYCFHGKTKVTNSRPHKKTTGGTWRRRQCESCLRLFSTYELPSAPTLQIASTKATSTAIFSLSRLTISIGKAFAHNEESGKTNALDLAQTIEQLLIRGDSTPSLEDIAILTHQTLERFDRLAAMQYGAQHDLLLHVRKPKRSQSKNSSQ